MDHILSDTEEILGLNDMQDMWSSQPGSMLNISASEEEMNDLLRSTRDESTPSTSTGTTTKSVPNKNLTGETGISPNPKLDPKLDLERKLRNLERERVKEKEMIEKLRKENHDLKEKEKNNDVSLPFGLEPERYLRGDMKDSTKYLAKIIIPRVKRVVDENKETFKMIFALGEVSEPVDFRSIRTCVLFNRGRICRDGNTHSDQKGNKRIHDCTVCWEVLWVFAVHRVVTCPLLTRKFYEKLGAKITP